MNAIESGGAGYSRNGDLPYIQHGNRRDYKDWFKAQVVQECLTPGASVSIVGRRHDINTNVIFRWCKEWRAGILQKRLRLAEPDGFANVGIVGADGGIVPTAKAVRVLSFPHAIEANTLQSESSPSPSAAASSATSIVELQLPGGLKIRIEGDVSKDVLRRVLAVARDFA